MVFILTTTTTATTRAESNQESTGEDHQDQQSSHRILQNKSPLPNLRILSGCFQYKFHPNSQDLGFCGLFLCCNEAYFKHRMRGERKIAISDIVVMWSPKLGHDVLSARVGARISCLASAEKILQKFASHTLSSCRFLTNVDPFKQKINFTKKRRNNKEKISQTQMSLTFCEKFVFFL